MADREVDILIVGGGLIGALLLIILESSKYSCLLVESKNLTNTINADFDARSIALSTASICILENLNIWSLIKQNSAVIDKIHVSEKGRFGSSEFKTDEESLGYVIEMQYLNKALHELINPNNILTSASLDTYDRVTKIAKIKTNNQTISVKAKLIVAADGANSHMRNFCNLNYQIKEYGQHAVVTNIGLARDHKNIAYERFTHQGPLALLPMLNSRASLVWSLSKSEAKKQAQISEHEFLSNLQRAFGYRLGKFIKVGQRSVYPLRQVTMPKTYEGAIVFIGNAAHTLHPVAGQGFNLGLRDVATLAQCIIEDGLKVEMLSNYQKLRQHDQTAIKFITEGLVTLFSNNIPVLRVARGLGLAALDNSSTFKHLLTSYTRGFGGDIPNLVCGIPIDPKET
ncbi:MAG: FAD-dependent monooxygenase [Legionellaceae bacterium]|nr:FAD-dependent monooxygenase [Legionellaceae bacterium]